MKRLLEYLLVLAALFAAPAAASESDYPELAGVFYDFEVAGYCGLVSEAVGRGFKRESRRLIRRHALDEAAVNRLRGEAWQAAHAEWQNRGLGGFRNWCRTDGVAAARRFKAGAD